MRRNKSNDFRPHIGVGFFKDKVRRSLADHSTKAEAERNKHKYQREWQKVTFTVQEVYFLTHKEHDSPFGVREVVPIGGHSNPPHFIPEPE